MSSNELSTKTQMHEEARSAPAIVAKQLSANKANVSRIGKRMRELQPRVVLTCARGSSDNAATYAKYLIETHAGTPTASFAPSVSSVYAAKQNMHGAVFLALSQSGKSPDLLASAEAAKEAGALVIALINVADSPLAELADEVIPLHAGDELSVAATKSYIATLSAIVQLVSAWTASEKLTSALIDLPEQLKSAWELDWREAVEMLAHANNFFVIGRGVGLGIAQEAALKFKETAGLHAEAYSAAEVRHGPMAIVDAGFPVLIFSQDDATRTAVDAVVSDFVSCGAVVAVAGASYEGTINLPYVADVPAATAPILFVQSFYRMVNALAVSRG
jgi:glucosamine--fructose-6-phosphate aminotransferase (isomerizing)